MRISRYPANIPRPPKIDFSSGRPFRRLGARFAGSAAVFQRKILGFYAQALCHRPLRGLF